MMILPKKHRIPYTDDEEIKSIIRLNGHRKEIYLSVYSYSGEPDKRNVNVNQIFIDFDPEKDDDGNIIDEYKPYFDCQKVAKYLKDNNISFFIRFSGRGYHLYVLTKHHEYSHDLNLRIKQYIRNLEAELGIKPDYQVAGDLRRMSRALNTVNSRTNLFCISISYNELTLLSHDEIKTLAKNVIRYNDVVYSGELVDLNNIEVKTDNFIYDEKQSINTYRKIDVKLPPCLVKLLDNPDIGYRERFLIILHLRELGYSINDVEDFIKDNISEEKAHHCLYEENQVESIFNRHDILFPECNTLKREGYCVGCGNPFDLYI